MKYYQHRAGLTEWEVEQQDFEEFVGVHGSGWSPLSKATAWAAWAERSGVRRAYRDTRSGGLTETCGPAQSLQPSHRVIVVEGQGEVTMKRIRFFVSETGLYAPEVDYYVTQDGKVWRDNYESYESHPGVIPFLIPCPEIDWEVAHYYY